MLVNKQRGAAFPDILAVNYAAAYLGWKMESAGVFRISRDRLLELVEEAGRHFESTWRGSDYVSVARQETRSQRAEWSIEDIEDALLIGVGLMFGDDGDAAPGERQDGTDDGRVVGFLHQKFRDFYAFGMRCEEWKCARTAPRCSISLRLPAETSFASRLWDSEPSICATPCCRIERSHARGAISDRRRSRTRPSFPSGIRSRSLPSNGFRMALAPMAISWLLSDGLRWSGTGGRELRFMSS